MKLGTIATLRHPICSQSEKVSEKAAFSPLALSVMFSTQKGGFAAGPEDRDKHERRLGGKTLWGKVQSSWVGSSMENGPEVRLLSPLPFAVQLHLALGRLVWGVQD